MRATADAKGNDRSEARANGMRCVVVASRFNGEIVEKLVEGALQALEARGAKRAQQSVLWVPGALEIPAVVRALVTKKGKKPDAVVCVGCVIKGGTDHYEHVCRATTDGIMRVAIDAIAAGKGPVVTNGVLTVANEQQARDRAGGSVGNKGAEAALAAIETRAVLRGIGASSTGSV
jgi:6,7-dimethyl-8-ribityllumazine synthase